MTDNAIAKIIRPIVIGNFKYLRFTIEKKDAKIKSIVLSSSMSSLLFSISEYPWFNSSTKNLFLFKNM